MRNKLFPILLVAYETIAYLSNDMYLPALPEMAKNLALSQSLVQLTVTAWIFGSSIWQLILGPISDQYGRRKVFLIGGIIFVLSCFWCAMTVNYTGLMAARFLQGSTACTILVCGYASIHELYDTKIAIQTISWMMGITLLAPAFGPLLGALVLTFANWRVIFMILGFCSTIIVILLYFHMPETRDPNKIQKFNLHKTISEYWILLSDKRFMSFTMMGFFIVSSIVGWIVISPMLVMKTFNYSMGIYCWLQVLVFGSFIIGTHSVKFLINKYTPIQLVKLGILISLCGGILILPILLFNHKFLFGLIFCLMIYCFGAAIGAGSSQRLALEKPKVAMGATMALFSTLLASGAFLGSFLFSMLGQQSLWPLGIIFIFSSIIVTSIFYGIKKFKILYDTPSVDI